MGDIHNRYVLVAVLLAAALLGGCDNGNRRADDRVGPPRPVEAAHIVPARQVTDAAHVPALDPHTMAEAEVRKLIGRGPRCEFRYTTAGAAAVGIGMPPEGSAESGVIKLNGSLVALAPVIAPNRPAPPRTIRLEAEPIRVTVAPEIGDAWEPLKGVIRREATMTFEVAEDLRVDYRGYIDCALKPITISHRR